MKWLRDCAAGLANLADRAHAVQYRPIQDGDAAAQNDEKTDARQDLERREAAHGPERVALAKLARETQRETALHGAL